MRSSRERLILLNLVPQTASTIWARLFAAFGDLDRLWAADARALQMLGGISSQAARRIVAGRGEERRLDEELRRAGEAGVAVVTLEDAEYPALLRTIPDPPLALYVRGRLADERPGIAVVGSRHASAYGLQCADRLGYDLALRGLAVVSGLARGIDGAAHEGALKAGGRALAVRGNGLAQIYPLEHEELAARVAEQGALVSEYPLETPPHARNFPRRNRIIAGLSLGVVVVEAARRSGALITADLALEQGREVFAVPGPMTAVTSQGTHALLKQGARLVTSVEDILEELGLEEPAPPARLGPRPGRTALEEPQARVFACVSAQEPHYLDVIASESGLAVADVSSALVQLELKRLVRQLPGKRFVRQ
jgi:DNA processing protein